MINKGKQDHPIKAIVAGVEGIGKSTFASHLPDPVFLDLEDGTLNMDVDRFDKPENAKGVYECIKYFKGSEYKTLVIDTIDWAERLVLDSMLKEHKKSDISDFGYGSGYTMLEQRISDLLQNLNDTGKHIVLLAHTHIKKFEEPDGNGSYDRYELKMSKKVAPLVKEWSDLFLFANYKTRVVEKDGKNKGIGGQERVMYTTRTASYDAKNRFGLDECLDFDAKSVLHLFKSTTQSKTSKQETVYEELARKWNDSGKNEDDKAKAFEWVGCDSMDLHWDELTEDQAKKVLSKL